MFSGSDVVNYGVGGWGYSNFWTFWEKGLLCTGMWFAGEVVDLYFLQFVII